MAAGSPPQWWGEAKGAGGSSVRLPTSRPVSGNTFTSLLHMTTQGPRHVSFRRRCGTGKLPIKIAMPLSTHP